MWRYDKKISLFSLDSAYRITGHFFPVIQANVEGDALVCVALPRSAVRSSANQSVKSDLITIGMSGSVGIHSWTPFDRSSAKNMTFERDPAMLNAR